MGLGTLNKNEGSGSSGSSNSSSRSSSSSSSSGSSGDSFPKYQRRCPQVVVTDEGEIREYPETAAMPFKKEWYSAPWEMDCPRPSDWVEVWWSESSWELDCRVYQDAVGSNLKDDLRRDPEETFRKLLTARSEYTSGNTVKESQRHRSCACCGEEIDVRYGDYESVNGSVVCESHNVQELAANNVI